MEVSTPPTALGPGLAPHRDGRPPTGATERAAATRERATTRDGDEEPGFPGILGIPSGGWRWMDMVDVDGL